MLSNLILSQNPEQKTKSLTPIPVVEKKDKLTTLMRTNSSPKILYSVGALRKILSPDQFKEIPDDVFGKLEQEEMNDVPHFADIVKKLMKNLGLDKKLETIDSIPTTLKDIHKLNTVPQTHYCKWHNAYKKLKDLKSKPSPSSTPAKLDRIKSLGETHEIPTEMKINDYKIVKEDYSKMVSAADQAFSLAEICGQRGEQQDSLKTSIIQKSGHNYNAVENFVKLSVKQREAVFQRTVAEMQEKHGKVDFCGTTLNSTVGWIDENNNLQISNINLGDSTTFYFILNEKDEVVECELLNTNLHKPNDPEEKARIRAAGGRVTTLGQCARLDGVIAISRSIGDEVYVPHGFSHNPDPWNKAIALNPGQRAFVVVGCDGLTEAKTVSKERLSEIVAANYKDFASLAEKLVKVAYEEGSKDNISAGVFEARKGVVQGLVINDGHGSGGDRVATNVGNDFFPTLEREIVKELAVENINTPEAASLIVLRK